LEPKDSLHVREILRTNAATPIQIQEIPNSEVFELMEDEELMREQRPAKIPE